MNIFQPPPNRRQNRIGDDHLLLWDFMQERDQWFDDLASFIAEAESEESEYSELDLFDIDTVNLAMFS